eukprot:4469591-Amphidinium_carterae.1
MRLCSGRVGEEAIGPGGRLCVPEVKRVGARKHRQQLGPDTVPGSNPHGQGILVEREEGIRMRKDLAIESKSLRQEVRADRF